MLNPLLGEVYLPPTPLHLGPLAAKVGPESSIRTLYVYWGLTLVRMDQILRRGASVNFGPLVAPVRFKRIGSQFWGGQGKGGAFCTVSPFTTYVQRTLCTVKAVSKTCRQPSARLRFAGASISIHILGPRSPYAPNGTFWYHFEQSGGQGRPDVSNG